MGDRRSSFLVLSLATAAATIVATVGCTGAIDNAGGVGPAGGGGDTVTGSGGGKGGNGGSPVAGPLEPGRVTMRRLNQTEYDNTVRDLLGVVSHPAATFITDTVANGFDNNGDLLTLSPVRLGQYQQAADSLATEALSGTLRTRNLSCDPATGDACVKTFVTAMGERAYRRPMTDDEVTSYLTLAGKVRTAGGSPDEVIGAVLQAILVSPNFLFRPEFDADPASLTPHVLSPFEMATRLSYLVYASMPDDTLYSAAKAGKLTTAKDIQTQLQRMLMDPKSRISQNYAEQWLGVRTVETAQPDKALYPAFSAALGMSMKREVDLFFDEFVRTNLPVDQLLTANFTYLDDSLAKHYGVPAVGGTDLSRVTLSTPQRGGLWGMGALLVATSRGNRTSPVARGRFTMDAFMCAPPPPPPATVQPPSDATITATDERSFLANHRRDPTCAACHNLMDPIGLGLENYDAIGAWRDTDHGKTIDASGVLIDGTTFNGRAELEKALVKDPRMPACLASQLLEYSLGRHLSDKDQGYVDQVAKPSTAGAKPGVRDLLMNVVASDAFRMRRGEPVAMGGKQ